MMLTNNMIDVALAAATLAVDYLIGEEIVKRPHLAVVVAVRTDSGFEVRAEREFGNREDWEHPYDQIARKKTELSARTGLPSRVVQELRPELLLPTDTKFWGNAIMGDLIVSCSGVQPWYDEAISRMIIALLKAAIDDQRRELAQDDRATYNGCF